MGFGCTGGAVGRTGLGCAVRDGSMSCTEPVASRFLEAVGMNQA